MFAKEKNDDYSFILLDLNKKNFKCAMGLNQIKVNKDICKYEKIVGFFFQILMKI